MFYIFNYNLNLLLLSQFKETKINYYNRGKYIRLVLKKFCKEKKVVMEFILSYTAEQNFIAKQSWCIFDTKKDVILVDSKLSIKF